MLIENVVSDVYSGYDDETLSQLAKSGEEGVSKLFSAWSAEANGLGVAFRTVTRLPKSFPLVFFSDHGVQSNVMLLDYESDNVYRNFVTWNPLKSFFYRPKREKQLKIVNLPHPFPMYWRRMKIKRPDHAKGTLVFLHHSTPSEDISTFFSVSYLDELIALPAIYHPIVLCLHRNDILKGEHEKIRQVCNFPILTMGFAGNDEFCDRFYNTLSHFRFATSTVEMSALYYCVDFGVPFFLYGSSEQSDPVHHIDKCINGAVMDLFSGPYTELNHSQIHFVNMMLGRIDRLDSLRLTAFVWSRFLSIYFIRLVLREIALSCFKFLHLRPR